MPESSAAVGDLIDLEVTTVAHGGVFVGRHEGRVVFVPDAIPGETVRVRLTQVGKKSFWRGETIEVLHASAHRQPHVWQQADVTVAPELRPGGADFGHITLPHQRTLKVQVLTEALQRFGGVGDEILSGIRMQPAGVTPHHDTAARDSADGTGWRTRVGLHVDANGIVGPFADRSHTVIPVKDYPLATELVERVALRRTGGKPGRIDLVQPADGRVRVIPRPEKGRGTAPEAREVIIERVGDREFRVDAGGFWQVHRLAAETLDAAVRTALGGAVDPEGWHLDLYGGVGLLASTVATMGGSRVTSVESDARATEHARFNLGQWPAARAETARVDRFVETLVDEATDRDRDRLAKGAIVLDPPRAGAGATVVRAVAALNPQTIVYVACDPVALARDVATFRDEGYELRAVQAFDLFPNSHHIEAVATLTR